MTKMFQGFFKMLHWALVTDIFNCPSGHLWCPEEVPGSSLLLYCYFRRLFVYLNSYGSKFRHNPLSCLFLIVSTMFYFPWAAEHNLILKWLIKVIKVLIFIPGAKSTAEIYSAIDTICPMLSCFRRQGGQTQCTLTSLKEIKHKWTSSMALSRISLTLLLRLWRENMLDST